MQEHRSVIEQYGLELIMFTNKSNLGNGQGSVALGRGRMTQGETEEMKQRK